MSSGACAFSKNTPASDRRRAAQHIERCRDHHRSQRAAEDDQQRRGSDDLADASAFEEQAADNSAHSDHQAGDRGQIELRSLVLRRLPV